MKSLQCKYNLKLLSFKVGLFCQELFMDLIPGARPPLISCLQAPKHLSPLKDLCSGSWWKTRVPRANCTKQALRQLSREMQGPPRQGLGLQAQSTEGNSKKFMEEKWTLGVSVLIKNKKQFEIRGTCL